METEIGVGTGTAVAGGPAPMFAASARTRLAASGAPPAGAGPDGSEAGRPGPLGTPPGAAPAGPPGGGPVTAATAADGTEVDGPGWLPAAGGLGPVAPRSPLARAFDGALVAVGAKADPGERVAAFVDLVRRYQEPGRHYHTLRHVAEMTAAFHLLIAADRTASADVRAPVCLLAVHFHDAVHDPRARDNEQRSADLAAAVLAGLGCPTQVIADVGRLVMATAGHGSASADEAFVNDADLRVLARPAPAYDRYVRRVRLEYAWLGDDLWAGGRGAVLRSLLDGKIYATDWARRHWEPAARANLHRELSALSLS